MCKFDERLRQLIKFLLPVKFETDIMSVKEMRRGGVEK